MLETNKSLGEVHLFEKKNNYCCRLQAYSRKLIIRADNPYIITDHDSA